MSGKDYLSPDQFAARRAARDAALQAAKDRHPAGKRNSDDALPEWERKLADESGEALKRMYIETRDSGTMKPVADAIQTQMTPDERKKLMKRRMRRQGL